MFSPISAHRSPALGAHCRDFSIIDAWRLAVYFNDECQSDIRSAVSVAVKGKTSSTAPLYGFLASVNKLLEHHVGNHLRRLRDFRDHGHQ